MSTRGEGTVSGECNSSKLTSDAAKGFSRVNEGDRVTVGSFHAVVEDVNPEAGVLTLAAALPERLSSVGFSWQSPVPSTLSYVQVTLRSTWQPNSLL
jgi:hypothetical protein